MAWRGPVGGGSVGREEIVAGLRELGVRAGDLLLVHSSLSSFGHVDGGAETVVDALLEAVGPSGTVLVPTHTWDRVNESNPVFDVRQTAGCVGLIPETFRRRPEALRGLHPTHSCAAIGPLAEGMLRDHETQVTPCGRKSPYQRLMDRAGKIVFIGVTLRVNTSFHAIEEICCVPWLFYRFQMLYTIDHGGRRRPVPSRRHPWDLDRDFEKMEPILEREGALMRGKIGRAQVRVVDAARMEQVIVPLLAKDPFFLLRRRVAERERRRYGEWASGRSGR